MFPDANKLSSKRAKVKINQKNKKFQLGFRDYYHLAILLVSTNYAAGKGLNSIKLTSKDHKPISLAVETYLKGKGYNVSTQDYVSIISW